MENKDMRTVGISKMFSHT